MLLFFLLLAIGITLISAITIIGPIASRKYKFDFVSMSIVSLGAYVVICATAAQLIDARTSVTLAGLMGLFEATIDWKWIGKFNAYFDESSEEFREIIEGGIDPPPTVVISVVLIYMILGWVVTFFV